MAATVEQFMVGDEYLVAPVLSQGQAAVTLYLPAGRWMHWWSGQVFGSDTAGSFVTVPAPIGQPPGLVAMLMLMALSCIVAHR